MAKSIAVFGAGPALGRAVAQRYAQEGYDVALVARGQEPLDVLAGDLRGTGATAHVIAADLADIDGLPQVAKRVRAALGDPDVLYYGAAANAFIPVTDLTVQRAQALMPLSLYALVALVGEFLPAMVARGDGAILSAQGASAVNAMPHIAGGFATAAQRNYLQALHAAVADKGVSSPASTSAPPSNAARSMPSGSPRGPLVPASRTWPPSTQTTWPTCCGPCTRPRAAPKPATPKSSSTSEQP